MEFKERFASAIRDVPDYPKKGIIFKDITTVLKDRELFKLAIDTAASKIGTEIDLVAGIESRGFIMGSAIAYKLGKGFIPIRKKGKLPYNKISEEYELEYGKDTIEMHTDAVWKGAKVAIVDDLLATGGTARAAYNLVERAGGTVPLFLFLIELNGLKGRERLPCNVVSLISY